MAGSLSNHSEIQILRFLFSALPVSRPANRYVALHSGGPGENGSAGERLSRILVNFSAPDSLGRVKSSASLTFNWDGPLLVLTHWSLWTAPASQTCLGWGNLGTTINVGSGTYFSNEKNNQINNLSKTINTGALYCTARGLSNHARDLALNWLFRSVSVVRPTAWYIALHFTPPDVNGLGGEMTDLGRKPILFSAPVDAALSNQETIRFGRALYDWPRVSHFSIWDAPTGGNCLLTKSFSTPYDVANGEFLSFNPGNLKIAVN